LIKDDSSLKKKENGFPIKYKKSLSPFSCFSNFCSASLKMINFIVVELI